MNYNKYIKGEKDFCRHFNMMDITAEDGNDCEDYFDDSFTMEIDCDYDYDIMLSYAGLYIFPYKRKLSSCRFFGMRMRRKDEKLCKKIIRRIGIKKFCSVYSDSNYLWERQDNGKYRKNRWLLYELAKNIKKLSHSNEKMLEKYCNRYRISMPKNWCPEEPSFSMIGMARRILLAHIRQNN